ncbi:MAG: FAD-dependent monooxygenase [Planctomycetota bacterium]
MHCDVLVVGAGPAGASCARQLALGGARVILADRWVESPGKPCGEYLSPQGFAKLESLGVLEEVLRQPHRELEGVSLTGRRGSVLRGRYSRFMGHEPCHPRGLAIERRFLDPILRRKAEATPGVTPLAGAVLTGFQQTKDGVDARFQVGTRELNVRARRLVGADGAHSLVARTLGVDQRLPWLDRVALVGHLVGAPEGDVGELHLGAGGYGALAPVAPGRINLNIVVPKILFRQKGMEARDFFQDWIQRHESLQVRLGASILDGDVKVTSSMAHLARKVRVGSSLLIGDAAGFVDPFTGEGMFLALHTAELASSAVLSSLSQDEGSLRVYEDAFRRLVTPKIQACLMIQRLLSRPALADVLLGRVSRMRGLSNALVSLSGDYVPPGPRVLLGLASRALADLAGREAA